MTGFARSLSATSAASAFAWDASVVARSSSKYLPCLTSSTPAYPSECSASAIVRPCGSKTDGFKVTNTRARMLLLDDHRRVSEPITWRARPSGRAAELKLGAADLCGLRTQRRRKYPVENLVDVLELL